MTQVIAPNSPAPANSATVAPSSLHPVAPEERIGALDLLRGWAMFGVLLSNMYGFLNRTRSTPLDSALGWAKEWLIQDRFSSLLVILFGIGFGIQLMRAESSGRDVRATYYRRSAALLAIGIVHGTLIWHGDILASYALPAFALVMFRSVSIRGVLIAALFLRFVGPILVLELKQFTGLPFRPAALVDESAAASIFSHGTWMQVEWVRLASYFQWFRNFGLSNYPQVLASFLFGLWAYKSGYMRRVFTDPRTTRRLLIISLIAAGVSYVMWNWLPKIYPPASPPPGYVGNFPYPYFQLAMLRSFVLRLFLLHVDGMALAYACVMLLIWQRPRGEVVLRPLAAAGRMALTTYLTQSIVYTLLFYGYGLGWYKRVSFSRGFALTVTLFALQMALSTWWLARFRYGPVEWLWRTLTYGRAPVMRIS